MTPACLCLSKMNDTAKNEEDLSLKAGNNGAISSTATHSNDVRFNIHEQHGPSSQEKEFQDM